MKKTKKQKTKPFQILLRGYDITKMEELIKYYENKVPTNFCKADIMKCVKNVRK